MYSDDCGTDPGFHIVGGQEADPNAYPWTVSYCAEFYKEISWDLNGLPSPEYSIKHGSSYQKNSGTLWEAHFWLGPQAFR